MFEDILQKKEPNPSEIVYHANTNGYLLLSGKLRLGDLLEKGQDENYCTFDPYNLIDKPEFIEVLSKMIEYFAEIEDYEKCAYLRDYDYMHYQTVIFNHQKT